MSSLLKSLRSEIYKSRKTSAFWGTIILPLLICGLVTLGLYIKQKNEAFAGPPILQWMQYMSRTQGIMGTLILPMFILFIAYAVNAIEHKSDMWKSLFTLPLSKLGIYAGKYIYSALLVALTLFFFAFFTYLGGHLLSALKPAVYKFNQYNIGSYLTLITVKFFLSSLGILSIQFFVSLIWQDFLKPLGLGFIAVIAGIIIGGAQWQYGYLIPYSHPMIALMTVKATPQMTLDVNLFCKEIIAGIIYSIVFFWLGFVIVSRKSVK